MKIIWTILKIIISIVMFILALVGIFYLVHGGLTDFKAQYELGNKSVWAFIKWFFGNLFKA